MSNYAPEYTKRERAIIVLKHVLWLVPLYAVTELWLFDWLSRYADNANCYQYGSITGVHLLMYGLFVGLPLSFAIIVLILEGRRSIKILKVGQNPLPEEKVFRKTKYKYGYKAKAQPVGLLSVVLLLVIFSVWGAMQAYKLTQDIKPCNKVNKSVNLMAGAVGYPSVSLQRG